MKGLVGDPSFIYMYHKV